MNVDTPAGSEERARRPTRTRAEPAALASDARVASSSTPVGCRRWPPSVSAEGAAERPPVRGPRRSTAAGELDLRRAVLFCRLPRALRAASVAERPEP